MSTRTRIEFWTGERLAYETADELGIAAFAKPNVRPRRVIDYLEYARRKQRRIDDAMQLLRLAKKTNNNYLWHCWLQRQRSLGRNRFWKKQGYPNLRRAWAKRRENCARRRAEKAIEEERERLRKQLEQYGYIRP